MKHSGGDHIDVSVRANEDGYHVSLNTNVFGWDVPAWHVGIIGTIDKGPRAAFTLALRRLADCIDEGHIGN